MRRCLAWCAPFVALLSACSGGSVAGNSTETENTVTARAIRVDSLLPAWNRPVGTATVATLRLDASNFDFAAVDSLGQELAVERPDGSALPFERVFWDRRAARARLHVRLDSSLTRAGASLLLRWRLPRRERSDSAAVWAAVPDSQRLALTSVLVDDFEHGDMKNLLAPGHSWYRSASDSAKVSWLTLGAGGGGRTGNALGIGYSANAVKGRYALIGTQLGTGPRSLRALDSLVVWVRGSGTLAVAFDHLKDSSGTKAWAHFALDSAWRRLRIRPADLDTADGIGGNVGWNAVRDSVTNLTFLVNGGSVLWIDDVRLHGPDRDDLR